MLKPEGINPISGASGGGSGSLTCLRGPLPSLAWWRGWLSDLCVLLLWGSWSGA